MKFRFGHLARKVVQDPDTSLDILGVRSTLWVERPREDAPIPVPPMDLVASFEAHGNEGATHTLTVFLTDESGEDVGRRTDKRLTFQYDGEGYPLRSDIVLHLPAFVLTELGEYTFNLWMDGKPCGELSLRVVHGPRPGTSYR